MARNGRIRKGTTPKTDPPGTPLIIDVGLGGHGAVYELDPLSFDRLRAAFPKARPAAFINVGYDPDGTDFEEQHGATWPLVAQILTGLTAEQMQTLGGVRIHDPMKERNWDVPVGAVHA